MSIEVGGHFMLPNVGDSVTLMLTEPDKVGAYKVISRHFSYEREWCHINIVVTDLASNEYAARVKA